ncbi:Phosphate transport regulator (distant homolog of PhoU) [hydrothermal vent metagenome]|uniref:Phosphate transport regulator (Distant homolog of PhoU) n=1 Tax=hydrothermal vent metagenome TaxID=652676 RepID=A0A1W1CTI7_9ZZZZ
MTKNSIYGLFGKSPISPLQQHMELSYSCIKELNNFILAISNEDWKEAEKINKVINTKEGDADKLKKELRLNLSSNFMMPFSRQDLLDLLLMQDSIANITKDVSGLIINRRMQIPKIISDDIIKLTDVCVQTASYALNAINELDELLETAFSKRGKKKVNSIIANINKLESQSDKIQHTIRKKLFPLESELPPVDVIFYYRAIEWLGELADSAQRVGSRLEILLVK